MAKRDAADYITKDGKGSMTAPPERVARPATAAQMAQRKLKAPRGRLHSGVSSFGSPSFASTPSPFGQPVGGNNQSMTPFGNNNATGTSQFGASASFPPTQPSSNNFTPTPPSASFTFGAPATSNPFSNFGGDMGNSNNNNTNPFVGFGGQTNGSTNSQPDGDTMMESPQKKPPVFGSAFGTGSAFPTSAAPPTFGLSAQSVTPSGFGTQPVAPPYDPHYPQPVAQPYNPHYQFGKKPDALPRSVSGFGTQMSEESKPKASFFGQSLNASQSAANPFGQPASDPQSSNLLSGQSTSAINPPSSPFGQTPAASHASGNVFGSSVPPTQPSHGGPFGTSFGQAPNAAKSADVQMSLEVPKPAFNFAPSTSQPFFASPAAPAFTSVPASSNMNPQTEDSTLTSSAPDSVGPIFSGGSDSSSVGDIFKPNANARIATPNISAVTTETPSAKSEPFTFKPTSSSGQPGFSSNPGLFADKSKANNISGGLFGKVTSTEEPPVTVAAPTTLPSQVVSEQQPGTTSDDGVTAANLIEKAAEAETVSRHGSEAAKPGEKPNQSFKGFQPHASTQQPMPTSTTDFGHKFGAASNDPSSAAQQMKQPSQDPSSKPTGSQAKQPSSHASKPNSPPAKTSLSSTITPSTPSKAPAVPQSMPSQSEESASPGSPSQVRLRSHGSSAIPGYLDRDESIEHDSLSRLRNLNSSFQKKIAKLDPAADDFEEIVRHYVAQRANIGHALDLMERRKVGMKRKIDNSEADEETLNASKKARTETSSSQPAKNGMPQNATTNSSTSSSIQPPKSFGTQPPQTSSPGSNIGSSAGLFKTMMPSPAPASSAFSSIPAASKAAVNPFAGLESSAPLSSSQNPSAGPAAPTPTVARDAAQNTNPFASLGATSSQTSGSTHDSSSTTLFKPQLPSTTPTKSPPKKPAFEIPKFGAASGASFMDAFAQQSAKNAADLEEEAKRKRKAEDFDSDEDDEAEWERKYEEEQRAKRNKLESLSKSATAGFQPLVGNKENSATAKKFLNIANDKASNTSSASEKSTPSIGSAGFHSTDTSQKAAGEAVSVSDEGSNLSHNSEELEESGSQEEDSNQGSEEEHSEGDQNQDQDENYDEGEEQPSDEESEDEDIQAAMARPTPKRSLFDRIEPNPNLKPKDAFSNGTPNEQKKPNGIYSTSFETKATPSSANVSQAAVNSSLKSFGANGVLNSGGSKLTPEAPTMSPFTPINGSGSSFKDPFAPAGSVFASLKKPATEGAFSSTKTNGEKITFGSNTSEAAPTPTRSVLFGGSKTLGSGGIPGEGLFGSRPSTPSNDEPSRGSVFGNLGSGPNFSSSKGDNTYKPGTPIKFGTPDKDGPSVNITAATPPAKDDSLASSKAFPNLFGPKPSKPDAEAFPNVGFNFGGPTTYLTASPLLGASALSSAVSSRATSPGATDTESVNTDTPEDHTDEPQTSLMSSRPGEEDEEVLFEARSKALKFVTEKVAKEKKLDPGYHTQGVGQLRVLKHKTTGKTRLLLRAEPASNIVINTSLIPSIKYKAESTKGSGAVKFVIPTATGLDQWVAKVKTPAMADELASILEANKGEIVQK